MTVGELYGWPKEHEELVDDGPLTIGENLAAERLAERHEPPISREVDFWELGQRSKYRLEDRIAR